jgi:hypothetical protein
MPVSGKCPTIDETNWTDKQRSDWMGHLKAGTMRSYFVGLLFAVGAIVFVYKGYAWKEDWALNFAGAMAVSIALNPTPWDCAKHQVTLHGASAILFVLAIAYVCVFRSTDTLSLIRDPRTQAHFKFWYRVLGVIMVGSPLFALIYTELRHRNDHYIFSAEMAGIYAFSIFWVVKIREIGIISKERHFDKSIENVLPA